MVESIMSLVLKTEVIMRKEITFTITQVMQLYSRNQIIYKQLSNQYNH